MFNFLTSLGVAVVLIMCGMIVVAAFYVMVTA